MGALKETELLKLSHIEKISEVFDEPCLKVEPLKKITFDQLSHEANGLSKNPTECLTYLKSSAEVLDSIQSPFRGPERVKQIEQEEKDYEDHVQEKQRSSTSRNISPTTTALRSRNSAIKTESDDPHIVKEAAVTCIRLY